MKLDLVYRLASMKRDGLGFLLDCPPEVRYVTV
jgi:hypothetical protein